MPLYDEEGNPYRYEITIDKVRYKVRKGENLKSIAKKFNVAPADIKEWNVVKRNAVYPGRYLTLYVEKKEKVYINDPLLVKRKVSQEEDCNVYHEVKSGDTLFSISRKYNGVSVEKLRQLNNIGPDDVLKPGTVIKIQEGS
jgi:membrane-bound lytic murein transglycosylase D